mgnify:FL=1
MTQLEQFAGPVQVIAADPGMKDMFTVVDSQDRYSKLTKKQYNTILGVKSDQHKLERWKNQSAISGKENSIATLSVSTLDDYKQHVTCLFAVADSLHSFYGAKRVTRMRLNHHIRRDKLLDGFINQVFLDRGPPAMSAQNKKAAKKVRRWSNQRRRKQSGGADQRVKHQDDAIATLQRPNIPVMHRSDQTQSSSIPETPATIVDPTVLKEKFTREWREWIFCFVQRDSLALLHEIKDAAFMTHVSGTTILCTKNNKILAHDFG